MRHPFTALVKPRLLTGLLSLHALAACASSPATVQPHVLTLKMNQSLTLPDSGMRITFNGVRDNRCPADVQCISAGQAHADLWVEPEGEGPMQVTVAWGNPSPPPSAPSQASGYQFCFVDLSPRPSAGQTVAQADYTLSFSVGRLQAGAASNCDPSPALR